MGKRRAYRSTAVKKVALEKLLESAPVGDVHLGMDIGKGEVFTVIRWSDGTFEPPWKAKNPTEISELVALFQVLAKDRAVTVAMESTGTYGDALRQALSDAGLLCASGEWQGGPRLRRDIRRRALEARRQGRGGGGRTVGVWQIVALAV